jgi:hypothetical protein
MKIALLWLTLGVGSLSLRVALLAADAPNPTLLYLRRLVQV